MCNTILHRALWSESWNSGMGWLRLAGSLRLKILFAEHRLFCRALSQKRPKIWRSLLIVATPYGAPFGMSQGPTLAFECKWNLSSWLEQSAYHASVGPWNRSCYSGIYRCAIHHKCALYNESCYSGIYRCAICHKCALWYYLQYDISVQYKSIFHLPYVMSQWYI